MNTTMNELTLNEMDQVNGSGIILAAIGLGTACVCLTVEAVRFGRKIYKDIKNDKD